MEFVKPKKESEIFDEKFDVLWLWKIFLDWFEKEEEKEVVEEGPNKSSILVLLCIVWLLHNWFWFWFWFCEDICCLLEYLNLEISSIFVEATTGGNSIAWSKYESLICTCTNQTPPVDLPDGEAKGNQSLKGLKLKEIDDKYK